MHLKIENSVCEYRFSRFLQTLTHSHLLFSVQGADRFVPLLGLLARLVGVCTGHGRWYCSVACALTPSVAGPG